MLFSPYYAKNYAGMIDTGLLLSYCNSYAPNRYLEVFIGSIPYSGLLLREKIFANFMNQVQFVKILPSKCLVSISVPNNP